MTHYVKDEELFKKALDKAINTSKGIGKCVKTALQVRQRGISLPSLYIRHPFQTLHPLHRPDGMGGKSFTLSGKVNRVKGYYAIYKFIGICLNVPLKIASLKKNGYFCA
ncbi:MAG: hypothetical protein J6B31_00900 [Bacteroidaceae bacterium]|nr:hypothetical protein [Bacteroidaceae bacterium]